MKLNDCFERIYVIHLPHNCERKARLERNFEETDIVDRREVRWTRAISGDWCGAPSWFEAGTGAWGCLQSHVRIVQDAVMDGLDSYCVLEDDVVFHPRAPELLERLMTGIPEDWGQLYLGGQHLKDAIPLDGNPSVYRCTNVNRTHAFALHQRAFREFQRHIMNAPDYISRGAWHIDHQLGLAHENRLWNTYAPPWWLAGQCEGSSTISGNKNPRLWWNATRFSRRLPFVYLDPSADEAARKAVEGKVHFGNQLKGESREDIGLDGCVDDPVALASWLTMIAREAIDRHLLPGIQHPGISRETVKRHWKAGLVEPDSLLLDELLEYPFNGLFSHSFNEKTFSSVGFAVA